MLSCLSNTLMSGIVKITIDTRETVIMMEEANREDEWKPLPYELLYVKKFPDNDLTRELVNVLLNRLNHVGNGFFRNTLKDVVDIFDTITGRVVFLKREVDTESSKLDTESCELDIESSELDTESSKLESKHNMLENSKTDLESYLDIKSIIDSIDRIDKKRTLSKFCRVLSECCTNGQQIRHTIRNSTWTCTYNNNKLIMGNKTYIGKSPLNRFVKNHYTVERPDRTNNANAWKECEYYMNGNWRSMYSIQKN